MVKHLQEVNKGDKTIMSDELEGLKKMKDELDGFIHVAETSAERERLKALQDEVSADRKRVTQLNAKAFEIAIRNKSKIKALLDEAEQLRLESVDLSVDSWALENGLRTKQQEMYQLEQAIKQVK
jgi:hypothetical protein